MGLHKCDLSPGSPPTRPWPPSVRTRLCFVTQLCLWVATFTHGRAVVSTRLPVAMPPDYRHALSRSVVYKRAHHGCAVVCSTSACPSQATVCLFPDQYRWPNGPARPDPTRPVLGMAHQAQLENRAEQKMCSYGGSNTDPSV